MGASPYILLFFWLAAERDSLRSAAFLFIIAERREYFGWLKFQKKKPNKIIPRIAAKKGGEAAWQTNRI